MSNKIIKEESKINFYISKHKKDFITLADTIFDKSIKLNDKKIIWKSNSKKNLYLIIKTKSKIIGLIRIISRKVKINGKFLKCACLTSIGILPTYQKKGFGKKLLETSNNFLKNKFDVAMLIARRKLDNFYSQFGYKGQSEFCEMVIFNKNISKLKKKVTKNLNKNHRKIYHLTFNKKNGYFIRNKEDWDLVNFRIKLNNLKSISVYNEKKLIGYFVFNNSIIYEYAYKNKFIDIFSSNLGRFFYKDFIIKNPTDELVKSFEKNFEIKVTKRFCLNGGHMIKFFEKKQQVKYNINFLDLF